MGRRSLLPGIAAGDRRRRRARLALRGDALAPAPRRVYRHDDARDDRRLDRHAERRSPRLGWGRQVDSASLPHGAAGSRPGGDRAAPSLRARAGRGPHRGLVARHPENEARARDARDLPGPRHCGAHGREHRPHSRRHLRVRLRIGGGRRRPARAGVPRLSVDGRSGVAEGLFGGHPGRARQPAGRDDRRAPAGRRRGAGRRVHFFRLPRRRGIRHHHCRPAAPALRDLRAPRTHRMTRAGGWLVAAAALTLPLWLSSAYHLHVAIMAGIFGVLALSLNLLLGFTGRLSLGHAVFFGIGAYTSALLTLKAEWSFWPALAAGVALAGAAGWVIGCLALKLRGAYFVLVTISFAGVISLVSVNWIELTNGPLGLPGVPAPELFGWSLRSKTAYYYLTLGALALSYLVCARLVKSRIGRAFVALRENEPLAESIGVDVTHYLVLATVVSAAIAGLGGSLYAHYTRFVSPEVFLFTYTVTMVIMVVAGGKGTLAGPLVGAVLFTVLPEILRAAASWQWQMLAYGVLLVLLVFFLPRGIVPALQALRGRGAS